jgi:hypothetical protein
MRARRSRMVRGRDRVGRRGIRIPPRAPRSRSRGRCRLAEASNRRRSLDQQRSSRPPICRRREPRGQRAPGARSRPRERWHRGRSASSPRRRQCQSHPPRAPEGAAYGSRRRPGRCRRLRRRRMRAPPIRSASRGPRRRAARRRSEPDRSPSQRRRSARRSAGRPSRSSRPPAGTQSLESSREFLR